MSKQRIDKLLSHEGFGSRKDIKKILHEHKVFLNGNRVTNAGTLIDEQTDNLFIDDEQITLHKNIYLMMNKIKDTVSTNKDGEPQTVFDLLSDDFKTPYLQNHLHLIGRLDIDTEGLLLFTTDGTLTHKLISPKSHIDKTYFCILEKKEDDNHKNQIEKQFLEGIEIAPEGHESGFTAKSAKISWLDDNNEIKKYLFNGTFLENLEDAEKIEQAALLTIHEGKFHQVKRMFSAVQNRVIYLKRISIGNLFLDFSIPAGNYKILSPNEIEKITE